MDIITIGGIDMPNKLKYIKILSRLFNYYGINKEEFIESLKAKDNKYFLLLLLKDNNCLESEEIKEMFKVKTLKSINNNLRLAQEKLLINRDFRERFFELEDKIDKSNIRNL